MLNLRRIVPGDGQALERLAEKIRAQPLSGVAGFFLFGFPAAMTDRWAAGGGGGWLAEDDGICVGFAACSPEGELLRGGPETWSCVPPSPHLGLEKLAVAAPLRRRGIASRLATLAARDTGTLLSSVVTGPVPNLASLAWHASHGFEEIDRYAGDVPHAPRGFASVLLAGRPGANPPAMAHIEETHGDATAEAADFVHSRRGDFAPLPSALAGMSSEGLRAGELVRRHLPGSRGWLLRDAGRVVAAAILDDLGDEMELAVVSVAPEARGRGYGKALVAAAREHASRSGVPMFLSTSSGNAAACGAYAACGLRIERRIPRDRADGSDTVSFFWRP